MKKITKKLKLETWEELFELCLRLNSLTHPFRKFNYYPVLKVNELVNKSEELKQKIWKSMGLA